MSTVTVGGVKFRSIWQGAGVTNFFGEGWWYHHLLWLFGLRFSGTTFVTKTTTLLPRAGNMPLKSNRTSPKDLLPKCIIVDRKKQFVLNAVGLSGPGLEWLLAQKRWQKMTEPFQISLMSLAATPEERLAEYKECFRMLRAEKRAFRAAFGLQLNFACPNGGLEPQALVNDVLPTLEAGGSTLHVPFIAKLAPDIHPQSVLTINRSDYCDGFCLTNTLKWGALPDKVDWKGLFGTDVSPLAQYGGGGLSGAPLLPIVEELIQQCKKIGVHKHINAGGGIRSYHDARRLIRAGADSVYLASIAMLRPYAVQRTIKQIELFYSGGDDKAAAAANPSVLETIFG